MNFIVSKVMKRLKEKYPDRAEKDFTIGEFRDELKRCLELREFMGSYYNLSEEGINLLGWLGGTL